VIRARLAGEHSRAPQRARLPGRLDHRARRWWARSCWSWPTARARPRTTTPRPGSTLERRDHGRAAAHPRHEADRRRHQPSRL